MLPALPMVIGSTAGQAPTIGDSPFFPSFIMSKPSSVLSFLSSSTTISCLTVRLALLYVPETLEPPQVSWPPSIYSMVCRPVDDKDQDLSRFLGSFYPIFILLADIMTACALVSWGNHIRKMEDGDEEQVLIQTCMPVAIQPQSRTFGATEEEKEVDDDNNDETVLLPRWRLPHLSGHLYLWACLFASAAHLSSGTTNTNPEDVGYCCHYNGVFYNTISLLWRKGDAMIPMFAIPFVLNANNKQMGTALPLVVWLMLTMVYYYYAILPSLSMELLPAYSSPNLGLQWYFGMQVFDRFRPYFGIMLYGVRFVLYVPLALRLNDSTNTSRTIELLTCYWYVWTLFHPHPTVSDFIVALSLSVLSPRTLNRMSMISSLVALCAIPVPLILFVLDWNMWLWYGNGNANFIFFQSLAYNAFVTILFLTYCSAAVERQIAFQWTKEIYTQT